MSKYTTTINDILSSFIDEAYAYDYTVAEIIEISKDKFFNFDFEWYTDDIQVLNDFKRDFLLTYYNHYIGFETLGMFKTYLMAKLNVIMPYYKELYKHIKIGYDPFINVDVTYTNDESESRKGQNNYTDNARNTTKSIADYEGINSDNPQVTYANNDYASGMNRGENITNTESIGNMIHSQNDLVNRDNEYKRTEKGLKGKSKAEAIRDLKKEIVNINREIIELCRPLFLSVW